MPPKEGKSNSFLLGRIYERTEGLPQIKQDIRDIKQFQIRDHYRIKTLERTGGGFNISKLFKAFTIAVVRLLK